MVASNAAARRGFGRLFEFFERFELFANFGEVFIGRMRLHPLLFGGFPRLARLVVLLQLEVDVSQVFMNGGVGPLAVLRGARLN